MNSRRRAHRRWDIIITVCDEAAGEICPVWPGRPITAHWGVQDPAAVAGTDDTRRAAFMKAFTVLQKRIALLTSLRLDSLDRLSAQQQLRGIGGEP